MEHIKNLFRESRGRRAFKASLMLRQNGFDCPEPMALLEKRTGLLHNDSILVTAGVTDGIKFNVHFRKLFGENTSRAELEKRDILNQLGQYVGKLHVAGIFHGDLRTGNILLRNDGGKWRFYLIDNERTLKLNSLPQRLIVKNIVQLNMFRLGITNTDRMRFFKAYIKQIDMSDTRKNDLCRKVIRLTSKRLRTRSLHHGD